MIAWSFIYSGPQSDAELHLAPFNRLGAVSEQGGNIPYPEVSVVLDGGLDSDLCAKNKTHVIATAGLQVYNITAQRQIYDLFNQRVAQHPELETTRLVHEGYSLEGVISIDPDRSAYPLRSDHLLMYESVLFAYFFPWARPLELITSNDLGTSTPHLSWVQGLKSLPKTGLRRRGIYGMRASLSVCRQHT